MKRENNSEKNPGLSTFGETSRGFFGDLISGILRDLIGIVIAFVFATGISALVCLYYGLPLVLSLIGGFIVIAVFLFLRVDA